ncbi:MAG TPA: ATP-binding protein [Streptosporangiaceae bacterium]
MSAASGAKERMSAASGAKEEYPGVSGALPAHDPGLRWRRVFPGEERQISVLRRWLTSLLPDCPAREDAAYVATELGSNAVRHTASGRGGWLTVEVTWHRAVLRVAVADCGSQTWPRMIEDSADEHGRGLLLVRGLALHTGVCGDDRGRLVWADIPWPDPRAVPPPSWQEPYEAAIRDAEVALAKRFAGVHAWFGRSTMQWWALPRWGELITAPTARELAILLNDMLDARPAQPPPAWRAAGVDPPVVHPATPSHVPGDPTTRHPPVPHLPQGYRPSLPQGSRSARRTFERGVARSPGIRPRHWPKPVTCP